jgi:hypothetical protein
VYVLTESIDFSLSKQSWKFVDFKSNVCTRQLPLCAPFSQIVLNYINSTCIACEMKVLAIVWYVCEMDILILCRLNDHGNLLILNCGIVETPPAAG